MANSTNPLTSPFHESYIQKESQYFKELDLIEVQKNSWNHFLQEDLKRILEEFFPIEDYTGKKFSLFFEDLYYGDPRYPLDLCLQKKLTYDSPVYLKVKLLNKKTGSEKSQDVYFFNVPNMTDRGTFIINGIERAIINQIVRSPGIYFTAEIDKTTGLTLYNAEVRPYIGAWLDFTINKHGIIEIKVNKKRKFLASVFLRIFDGESTMILENWVFSRLTGVCSMETVLIRKHAHNLIFNIFRSIRQVDSIIVALTHFAGTPDAR
jgi:DNA-directed RNA polymerase subunit beta